MRTVSQSVRETGRVESQSAPSPEPNSLKQGIWSSQLFWGICPNVVRRTPWDTPVPLYKPVLPRSQGKVTFFFLFRSPFGNNFVPFFGPFLVFFFAYPLLPPPLLRQGEIIEHQGFSSNFSDAPSQDSGISLQHVCFPWVSREIQNFLAATPSHGRPPPYQKTSRPKSFSLYSFFLPEQGQKSPRKWNNPKVGQSRSKEGFRGIVEIGPQVGFFWETDFYRERPKRDDDNWEPHLVDHQMLHLKPLFHFTTQKRDNTRGI